MELKECRIITTKGIRRLLSVISEAFKKGTSAVWLEMKKRW